VSGWQRYDNKGRVIEKFEPFFAQGWDYAPPRADQSGARVTMFYDPRGRMVRTHNPDGSQQLAVFGVPHDFGGPPMDHAVSSMAL
jgi:YD repeat-containing protein